jgi:phage terminase small subunit
MSRSKCVLSPQRERFALAVVSGETQAEAYRLAYPRSRKWKPEALWVAGAKLVAKGKVSVRVAELREKAAKRAEITAADVLTEAAQIAFSDIRKLFDENGNLKSIHELDDDTAASIAAIEYGPLGVVKIKFWDKNAALEKLFKHLGLFKADNKQRGDAVAELLAAIDGRSTRLTVKDDERKAITPPSNMPIGMR